MAELHELYWLGQSGYDLNRLRNLSGEDWKILMEITIYYKEREQEQMIDLFKLRKK